MGHYVYKYVYDGEVIYIGKNDTNLRTRIKQHAGNYDIARKRAPEKMDAAEIYYCKLPNSVMSDVIESALIKKYLPECNSDNDYKKKCNWAGFPLPELEWIHFKGKEPEEIPESSFYIEDCLKKDVEKIVLQRKEKKFHAEIESRFSDVKFFEGEVTINNVADIIQNCIIKRDNSYIIFEPYFSGLYPMRSKLGFGCIPKEVLNNFFKAWGNADEKHAYSSWPAFYRFEFEQGDYDRAISIGVREIRFDNELVEDRFVVGSRERIKKMKNWKYQYDMNSISSLIEYCNSPNDDTKYNLKKYPA